MALQTLSKTNIANGNTIQAADVSQSIDAFTGAVGYAIIFSGSFTLSGATTGSGFWQNAVSSSLSLSSSYASSSSLSLSSSYASSSTIALSSSYASSSSLSLSSSYASSSTIANGALQVNTQYYDNGTNVVVGDFKFISGKGALNTGKLTSSIFTVLAGKTIGNNVWISPSYVSPATVASPQPSLVVAISSSGALLIQQSVPNDNVTVMWTGFYI
jgi:hypothetical protein